MTLFARLCFGVLLRSSFSYLCCFLTCIHFFALLHEQAGLDYGPRPANAEDFGDNDIVD